MDKFSFKNPFSQTFEQWRSAAQLHTDERAAQAANALFEDKPYTTEHKKTYLLAAGLRWAANVVSFLSAYFAAYYVFSVLFGGAAAAIAAGGCCLLIELLKNSLWTTTAKGWLKYRVLSWGAVLVLVGLHVLSFGASVFGAYIAADHLPTESSPKDTLLVFDAGEYDKQLAAIDAQAAHLSSEKPNPTTGKISSSTKTLLQSLNAQRETLLNAKKTALERFETEKQHTAQERKKNAAKANLERSERVQFYRLAAAYFAGIFELIFIVCQLYVLRYLFRAYIDNSKPVTQPVTGNVTQPVTQSQPVAGNDAQRPKIGFFGGKSAAAVGAAGSCANCGKEFVKNSHSHKFCSDGCRIESWERKHGKKMVKG